MADVYTPRLALDRAAARQRLADILSKGIDPTRAALLDTCDSYPDVELVVRGRPISLPLSDGDAQALFRDPSGNPNPRYKIFRANHFSVSEAWSEFVEEFVEENQAFWLGLPAGFRVVPARLLLFSPGDPVYPPGDRAKRAGCIGTIAVTLPSTADGGRIILRVQHPVSGVKEIVPSTVARGNPAHDVQLATSYWDVERWITEIHSGYRLILEYDLKMDEEENPLCQIPWTRTRLWPRQEVEEAARECMADPDIEREIYCLGEQLKGSRPKYQKLRGSEDATLSILAVVAHELECIVLTGCIQTDKGGRLMLTIGLGWKQPPSIQIELSDILPRRTTALEAGLDHRALVLMKKGPALKMLAKHVIDNLGHSEIMAETLHRTRQALNSRTEDRAFPDRLSDAAWDQDILSHIGDPRLREALHVALNDARHEPVRRWLFRYICEKVAQTAERRHASDTALLPTSSLKRSRGISVASENSGSESDSSFKRPRFIKYCQDDSD